MRTHIQLVSPSRSGFGLIEVPDAPPIEEACDQQLWLDCPFCGAPRTRPCVMVTKFGIRVAKGPHSARIKRAKQEAMR